MKIKHPDFITIKKSSIPGAGLGVFAVQAIKKGKRLGEYSGEQLNLGQFLKKKNTDYCFEINRKNKPPFYIDGKFRGSWHSKVNGAKTNTEKKKINVVTYQYNQKIYFKTVKNIKKGQELLIDYGESYWFNE
jgi:SET domain-containing protein